MEDSIMDNSVRELIGQVLGSIDAGVMLVAAEDVQVIYENGVIGELSEVKEAILEDLERHRIKCDMKPYGLEEQLEFVTWEFCHEEYELWYEIKTALMVCEDGSLVYVCTVIDITRKKLQSKKVEFQECSDFLTGLYNRKRFEEDLKDAIESAVENNGKGAVLFTDLEDLKHINEGLGHQYGDVLLQEIAKKLCGIKGLKNNCYRIGGDEFVVLLKEDLYEEIDRVIADIKELFNAPWKLLEVEHFCAMSMGVAIYPDNSTDVHDIIRMASQAMYDARMSGKNQTSFYTGTDGEDYLKKYELENNMRQAIATELDEFVVFYQPVVDAVTKECISCEALIRWDSKALGFMHPGEFIPLAEYLGLITDIGDYVLEEACKQCKKWNDAGFPDFSVHVNLSVVQLLQKNAVDNIRSIIEESGVNPANIVLEITESFAINDMDRVLKIIEGLKALGPGIALDDFGTGYSSLNYIKQLPLNVIKVDKTFIDDIAQDEYAQAFVKLIVDLSKTIGTKIVVEGVEWQTQYEVLKELGVNYIQGFLFGKPVNPNEFEEKYLRKGECL